MAHQLSEKSSTKKWNMQTSLPYVPTIKETLPNFEVLDSSNLSCGCCCIECKNTYKAYWLKKIECDDLSQSLAAERNELKFVIDEIKKMESSSKKTVADLRKDVEIEKLKYEVLQKSLNEERQYRIEDIYKAQQTVDCTKDVLEENERLKSVISSLNEQVSILQNDNNRIKTTSLAAAKVNQHLILQLEKDELELRDLETNNAVLRSSLYESTVGLAKAKKRDFQRSSSLLNSGNFSMLPAVNSRASNHVQNSDQSRSGRMNSSNSGLTLLSVSKDIYR